MKRRTTSLLIILGVILGLLLGIRFLLAHRVQIVRVYPPPGGRNIDPHTSIEVIFNRPIKKEKLGFAIKPKTKGELVLGEQQRLIRWQASQPLKEGTIYQVNIFYPPRLSFSWAFATRPAEKPKLKTKAIKQRIIAQLPKITAAWSLEYFPKTDQFICLITADPFEKYYQEVLEFLSSFGLQDPASQLNLYCAPTRWRNLPSLKE